MQSDSGVRAESDPSKLPFVTEQDISIELPDSKRPRRPSNVTHLSTPAYESPLRHHRRQVSTPRLVKETLHAHSEYTNSEDDGAAIHRINQYIIKQEIGRGSFGAVHLAIDQHNNEYAVKEFSKSRLRKRAQSSILRRPQGARRSGHSLGGLSLNSPLHRRSASDIHEKEQADNPLYLIKEEIAIMKKLNHHNLVGLLEVLDDPTEDSLYMVLEMCKKGVVMKLGVGERADPYDSESCRCWFRDLILGIEYLHAQGVVHRDIKPDNLLLTEDDELKIVDFGVSEIFEKSSDMTTKKSAGSPAFLPPELCVSNHGAISGKAADIWSMGVTLYCLYFGRVPFEKTSVLDLYESIKGDEIDLETNGDDSFAHLMHRLLNKDPDKRIKMDELREHPWVTKAGTDPLLSAEENTENLVGDPTEEEVNRAITGNLSNLLVVMKAVRKFRGLLSRKRPYDMDSILGQDSLIVKPPLAMERKTLRASTHRAHSEDAHDRMNVEQVLASEGVHHKIDADMIDHHKAKRRGGGAVHDGSATADEQEERGPNIHHPSPKRTIFANPKAHRADTGRAVEEHQGKGQARDPLDEVLFLSIGPGGGGEDPPDPPAVSESPPAAEVNIYETAYHDEVKRIRSMSQDATLYLTRRIDKKEQYVEDKNMVGVDEHQAAAPASGFARLLEKAREKGAQAKEDDDGKACR